MKSSFHPRWNWKITTKVSHLDSLWKRDWRELGNGLLPKGYLVTSGLPYLDTLVYYKIEFVWERGKGSHHTQVFAQLNPVDIEFLHRNTMSNWTMSPMSQHSLPSSIFFVDVAFSIHLFGPVLSTRRAEQSIVIVTSQLRWHNLVLLLT